MLKDKDKDKLYHTSAIQYLLEFNLNRSSINLAETLLHGVTEEEMEDVLTKLKEWKSTETLPKLNELNEVKWLVNSPDLKKQLQETITFLSKI